MTPTFLHWPTAASGGSWSPSSLTSLAAWYDADDSTTIFDATTGGSLPNNGGSVFRWEDKSGNARHLTAAAGLAPTYATGVLNGKPNLTFTQTQYLSMNAAFMYAAGACTVATIPSGLGGVSQNFLISEGRSTSNNPVYSPFCRVGSTNHASFVRTDANATLVNYVSHALGGTYPLIVVQDTGSAMSYSSDGGTLTSYVASYTRAATTLDRFAIGVLLRSSPALGWDGSLPEVVICDAVLSQSDREKLEGYLAHKWGLTSNLPGTHPYKSTAP